MRRLIVATLSLVAGAGLVATAGDPQADTPSQLLEAAIYAHETTGDLDAAAALYRRLLAMPDRETSRSRTDITRTARLRLAEALRRKGDAASVNELTALAHEHPEVERLIRRQEEYARTFVADRRSALAEFDRVERERAANAANCCGLYSASYDPRRTFQGGGHGDARRVGQPCRGGVPRGIRRPPVGHHRRGAHGSRLARLDP